MIMELVSKLHAFFEQHWQWSAGLLELLWMHQDKVLTGRPPTVPVLSKVGAGDSMVAGLLKGLTEKDTLNNILRMGIAAGTAAVMTPSDELCYQAEYEALLDQVQIKELVTQSGQ